MFGFLNVYKPKGMTSHDVVSVLRRITKIKQIGHTGTLDPFAEGVLPICIGKATRLIEYLADDKAYIATVNLGSSTTTYDIEGEVTGKSDKIVSKEDITRALKHFEGEIEQLPPIYSAIKVKGKKLYEYARKGENIEIKPRTVNIKKIEMTGYNEVSGELELYVHCSKGTYIRSIANDLGNMLGTFGYLTKLIRVQAGDFMVEDSVSLDILETIDIISKNIICPLKFLHYPQYELNETELECISHGMKIRYNYDGFSNFNNGSIIILTSNNKIAGIGIAEENSIKCNKVFV